MQGAMSAGLVWTFLCVAAEGQIVKIEGCVHTAGVEFPCVVLDDLDYYPHVTFLLIDGGTGVPPVGRYAIVWGVPRDLFTICMVGRPFEVLSFAVDGPCQALCQYDVDCDDDNVCTADHCETVSGQCQYTSFDPCCPAEGVCNDNNPCTQDWACTGDGRCAYPPLADGTSCTVSDPCSDGTCVAGFCEAVRRVFDTDCNGAINLDDVPGFVTCVGGPDADRSPTCEFADVEGDGDVDFVDAAGFQRAFGR